MGLLSSWRKTEAPSGGKLVATLARTQGGDQVQDQVVAIRPGDHRYGAQTGIAAGNTATLVTLTVPSGQVARIWGFKATGTGDGRFSIEIAASERYFDVLSIVAPAPHLALPAPEQVAEGVVVALKVKNTSAGVADYQGVLLVD